jgi:hypothetical protein
MKTETIEMLRKARGFLERGWAQGSFAVDAEGEKVVPGDDSACAWCVQGSLLAASNWKASAETELITTVLLEYSRKGRSPESASIVKWNDTPGRTKEEVLTLFDKTIERLESEL